MREILFAVASLAAFQTLAIAGIQPLPFSYTGVEIPIQAGYPESYVGSSTLDGGGEFSGWVSPSGLPSWQTAFWCVDDQLYFNWGESGTANIIPLSFIPLFSSYVQYGSVSNAGPPNWTNTSFTNTTTLATSPLPDTAQARYEMAAWLVSQYDYINNDLSQGLVADSKNTAIQEAIWAITANNQGPNEVGHSWGIDSNPTGADLDTSNNSWINHALSNYQNVNPNYWAVVSWNAPLIAGDGNWGGDGNAQTFLAYLGGGLDPYIATPEPGFYGALALGLAGLAFSVRRRKVTSQKNR